jgi:hypothetical protein
MIIHTGVIHTGITGGGGGSRCAADWHTPPVRAVPRSTPLTMKAPLPPSLTARGGRICAKRAQPLPPLAVLVQSWARTRQGRRSSIAAVRLLPCRGRCRRLEVCVKGREGRGLSGFEDVWLPRGGGYGKGLGMKT